MKWRFIGQEGQKIAWSIYPQFQFNVTHSSVTRHLEDDGYQFLMPTEITVEMWHVEINGEVGRNFVEHGSDGWIAGLSTEGHIAPRLELLAELHRDEQSAIVAVGGGRFKLTPKIILLLASGHSVRMVSADGPRTYLYAGLQLNIPRQFVFGSERLVP